MTDAIKLAIDALESVAIALPLNRGTVKTCYAINDIHRDAVHAALAALRAQPDHSELVKDMRSFIELWKYVSPNPSAILTRAANALEGKA